MDLGQVDHVLAQVDRLLHQAGAALAPDPDEEEAGPMVINTWALAAMFTDLASGECYVRLFSPKELPAPFLRGLLMTALDTT